MAGTIVADTIQNGTGTSTSMNNAIYGSAKAWVKFSVSGSTVTVNGNYNFTSVTRGSQGYYIFTMTNALADANYSVVTSQGIDTTGGTSIMPVLFRNGSGANTTPTTTSFTVAFIAPSTGALYDPIVTGLVVND
jgi:hypothetical protein